MTRFFPDSYLDNRSYSITISNDLYLTQTMYILFDVV